MSSDSIKTDLKALIEQEGDITILKAIKALLQKTALNPELKEKLTRRAIQSEDDIKKGRILTKAEIVRLTEKRIRK